MDIFVKIERAQAQCPDGKAVMYDGDGRIAYVTPKDFHDYEMRGYTAAHKFAPSVTPKADPKPVEITETAPKVFGRPKRK